MVRVNRGSLLSAVLLVLVLFTAGCGNPNTALNIDKFTLQFRREAIPPTNQAGDDDDSAGDDDDSAEEDDEPSPGDAPEARFEPGSPVQKRVTITNGSNAPVNLHIYLDRDNPEAPNHEAFTIQTPAATGLAEPYNYEVQAHARLELEVEFNAGEVGWNYARLVVEDTASEFRREIILQGEVDCISLGFDQDGDGYCSGVGGADEDCNDNSDTGFNTHPGAQEVCEEGGASQQVDNDCDGTVFLIADEDGDGWCDQLNSCAATMEELQAVCPESDCDDTDPTVSPGQPEVCEESGEQVDNDCDPSNDQEALSLVYVDNDLDGRGAGEPIEVCGGAADGFSGLDGDCDDSNPTVSPDLPEVCDGLDSDCDGSLGPGEFDGDGDGVIPCQVGPDGVTPLDCDDTNPAVYAGHAEVCDGLDSDCDGSLGDGTTGTPDEADGDGDGYLLCEDFVANGAPGISGGGDCDDAAPQINPGATELACDLVDTDCSGEALPEERDDDGDGFVECDGQDCDDTRAWVYSSAVELCDGLDTDCDGAVGSGSLGEPDERDQDGDGHVVCELSPLATGLSGTLFGDCNDDPSDPVSANVYPFAPEISDSYFDAEGLHTSPPGWRLVDNQCPGDPGADDGDALVEPFEYCFGTTVSANCNGTSACFGCSGDERDQDGDGLSAAQGDCDDSNALARPGLAEICDGVDNDCDGVIPSIEVDGDGDGYVLCDLAAGISIPGVVSGGDCDDGDATISPVGVEDATNEGVDNDCDSTTFAPSELDEDGDGVTVGAGDCDDANPSVFPGASEICDGVDTDCDGSLGDGTLGTPDERDQDLDGYSVCLDGDCVDSAADLGTYGGANGLTAARAIYPGALEVCDGWDNDCGGQAGAVHLPDPSTNPDEVDSDGDGFVPCQDPAGFGGWSSSAGLWQGVTIAQQANLDLSGGFDCADVPSDAPGTNITTSSLATIFPNAQDVCDGWDNPCLGSNAPFVDLLDDEFDDDGDRRIDCVGSFVQAQAENAAGLTLLDSGDCDDADATVYDGAPEICDGIDNDCDGALGDGQLGTPDERDQDNDGYRPCLDGDCVDSGADLGSYSGGNDLVAARAIYPGATEFCDGWDNDCNGQTGALHLPDPLTNPGEVDGDGDGFVSCQDPVGYGGWSGSNGAWIGFTIADQANLELTGGLDCADVVSDAPGTAITVLSLATIYPNAPDVCDGWDNPCLGSSAPFVDPLDDEFDDDGDRYIDCDGSFSQAQAENAAGQTLLGSGDCLDEAGPHFQNGEAISVALAASVHPGVAGDTCDGFDSDCSQGLGVAQPYRAEQADEWDLDGDSHTICTLTGITDAPGFGGDDCNDSDVEIYPSALDDFSQAGVDNDCDLVFDEEGLSAGDVILSEFIARPSNNNSDEEWIELYNRNAEDIRITNWTFTDQEGDVHTVTEAITIPSGDYVVLCRDVTAAESESVDCDNSIDWTNSFSLGDNDGEVRIDVPETAAGTILMDLVDWLDPPWDIVSGRSLGLDPSLVVGTSAEIQNDIATNWCRAPSRWAPGTDRGSPGMGNPSCDVSEQDNDEDGWCEFGQDLDGDGDCSSGSESSVACPGGVCDCNDAVDTVYNGAPEICDGFDSDCADGDGNAEPDGDPLEVDADGDGYLVCTLSSPAPVTPSSIVGDEDCDDNESSTFPGAVEACDSVDSDCDQDLVDGFANNDSDGLPNCVDPDDDNDGALDGVDSDDNDPLVCSDTDGDSCDDCSSGSFDPANDGTDTDGDGDCDAGDLDDDGDGVVDAGDVAPLDGTVCLDSDGDDCDDCALGTYDPANDGTDTDGDGVCDSGGSPDFVGVPDPDDDNDGVLDGPDSAPLNPDICTDADGDGCDDCSVGVDDFGAAADNDPSDDGADFDGDGLCDAGDPDDDEDGALDAVDSNDNDPLVCSDTDGDGCEDCSSGGYDPANDGTDTDGEGICNAGDTDDDNDGVLDGADSAPLDPDLCADTDGDGCDDCAVGVDDFGALADNDPDNDGTDFDGDGLCDAGDPDDDNDGAADAADSDDNDPLVCSDTDGDSCEDCSNGSYDPANDGLDTDGDGTCDATDSDKDGDGVVNGADSAELDPTQCLDGDADTCDDCSSGTYDPANDGTDVDGDGECDATDCDDNVSSVCSSCAEVADDGIDQDCNGFDTVSCFDDLDVDGYGVTTSPPRYEPGGACLALESNTPGDCNDSHALVTPFSSLLESPTGVTLESACFDADGDGYCLGGGIDTNNDGDCQDHEEDWGSISSGPVADCDETTVGVAGDEHLLDFSDNNNDGIVDEGCFGGGELVITEYFSDSNGDEWLEVMNVAWFDVFINGWTIDDEPIPSAAVSDSDVFGVSVPYSIPAGARAKISDPQNTTGALVSWNGGQFSLEELDGTQSEGVRFLVTGSAVDVIYQDFSGAAWIVPDTFSLELSETQLGGALVGVSDPDATNPANWCQSSAVGGSAGAVNSCP